MLAAAHHAIVPDFLLYTVEWSIGSKENYEWKTLYLIDKANLWRRIYCRSAQMIGKHNGDIPTPLSSPCREQWLCHSRKDSIAEWKDRWGHSRLYIYNKLIDNQNRLSITQLGISQQYWRDFPRLMCSLLTAIAIICWVMSHGRTQDLFPMTEANFWGKRLPHRSQACGSTPCYCAGTWVACTVYSLLNNILKVKLTGQIFHNTIANVPKHNTERRQIIISIALEF